jgi:atypical dual specificity phosphatase
MPAPYGFTWLKRPLLAALARPSDAEDFAWLRANGIQVVLSLTEDPLRRDWVNDAGLMVVHEPIEDFTAPTQEQLDRCLSVIERAHSQEMGVAIHCAAGRGRTGTVLGAWFVTQGLDADRAIEKVRQLRPGSIETDEQVQAIKEFARRRKKAGESGANVPQGD